MSERPYMQLYIADYLGDTQHLSCEQHGAYLLLLMTMWRHGGELPNDEKKLARICRISTARWRKIAGDVLAFFSVSEQKITQKRLEKELKKARDVAQKRSAAASAKSLNFKEPNKANATTNAPAKEEQLRSKRAHVPSPLPEDSEPNGSGADAPVDWKAVLFDESLTFLSETYGKPRDKYRSLLGKWRKALSEDCEALVEIIREAEVRREADPVAWIEAAIRLRRGEREPGWKRENMKAAEDWLNA